MQQQAPELMFLASEGLLTQQDRGSLLHEHDAASVCLPDLRCGSPDDPGHRLESLAATVSHWVIATDSPAHGQLTAVGCSPQQLQQQLDALLSAQHGTQQGLTDASLAALVQQLQATGTMLSNIAVPHFCNNPACTNLNGPTEVRWCQGAAASVQGAA